VIWVFRALAVLIALVLLVVLVGYMLPQDHVATVEEVVPAAPERVWAAMTDVEAYPGWRRGVQSVEILPARDGRLAWREVGANTMSMGVEESEPGRRWLVRILDDDLPFGGTWTYEIEPEGTGTRVTLAEDGSVYNPVFRFVSRFVMGHDATMRAWLEDLRAHLGEDAA
jgi:uncharacterized protein YndB with AHSA1/START domain